MKKLIAKVVELPDATHIFPGNWGMSDQGTVDLGAQKKVTIPAGHEISQSCACRPVRVFHPAVGSTPMWEHRDLTVLLS